MLPVEETPNPSPLQGTPNISPLQGMGKWAKISDVVFFQPADSEIREQIQKRVAPDPPESTTPGHQPSSTRPHPLIPGLILQTTDHQPPT